MEPKVFKFGMFSLNASTRELFRGSIPVKLQDQSFHMLCLLLERPNQVVTRDEIRARLWPDTHVDFDLALNTAVRRIRQALGDSAENPRFIETLPKRGYRFIAPVNVPEPESALVEAAEPPPAPPPAGTRRNWLVPGLITAAILLLALWTALGRLPVIIVPQKLDSLAVLPFVNTSGDPGTEYLTDGLAESLIESLSAVRSLRIMSPGTTSSFKGREVDPRLVGAQLHVAAVVQGKVHRRGDTLIVDADLVDASSGVEVWRHRYRRSVGEDLDLEREITADLIAKLRESLRSAEGPAQPPNRSTKNKEAYRHYLMGLYDMRQLSSGTANSAIQHFQQAIALDPDYALAYVGLGWTYQVLDDWVLAPHDAIPKSRAALQKALALDPTLSAAHTNMGTIYFWYEYDQQAAERELLKAMELNPDNDDAHDFYGWYLVCHKKFEQGLTEHRRALELSPLDLTHRLTFAQSLYFSRKYDEAQDELKKLLPQNPNTWFGHLLLGWVYEQKGDLRGATEELEIATRLEGNIAEPLASLGRLHALNGNAKAAREILGQLKESAKTKHIAPYDVAFLYAALGEDELAINEIRRAYEQRSWMIDFLGIDPKLDRLRKDPRVQAIIQQAGLN